MTRHFIHYLHYSFLLLFLIHLFVVLFLNNCVIRFHCCFHITLIFHVVIIVSIIIIINIVSCFVICNHYRCITINFVCCWLVHYTPTVLTVVIVVKERVSKVELHCGDYHRVLTFVFLYWRYVLCY